MLRGQRAGVGEGLHDGDGVIELITAVHGLRLLPGAGVGIDGVVEALAAAVGDGVRPGGGAEQGKAEDVAGGVIAVL